MYIPAGLLTVAIIFYIEQNRHKIKRLINDVGLLRAICFGLIYLAIGAWILFQGGATNTTTLFMALMMLIILEIYSQRNKLIDFKSKNSMADETSINLHTLCDIMAKEIVTMREQLSRIVINQNNHGCNDNLSKEFSYKKYLYSQYRENYIFTDYRSPDNKKNEWGCVILIVGEDIFGNIMHYDKEEMNIEKLFQLHRGIEKSERRPLHKGSTIYLYLEEKGIYEDLTGTKDPLRAEIISIKKDHNAHYSNINISLKIDLNSYRDSYPTLHDPEPKFITRTIDIYEKNNLLIDDETYDKSQNESN